MKLPPKGSHPRLGNQGIGIHCFEFMASKYLTHVQNRTGRSIRGCHSAYTLDLSFKFQAHHYANTLSSSHTLSEIAALNRTAKLPVFLINPNVRLHTVHWHVHPRSELCWHITRQAWVGLAAANGSPGIQAPLISKQP